MPTDKQLNIIIWAFPSWNGDYVKSTVELAKELAVRHKVTYIDYAYTLKDVLFAGTNASLPVKRVLGAGKGLTEIQLNSGARITVLSLPPVLPYNWTDSEKTYKAIQWVNYHLVSRRINKALKTLNFEPDIVINAFNPFFGNAALQIFRDKPLIYYCYDNINATVWASKHGTRLENELATKVNAVIFSSDALKSNKQWDVPAYVVKNGVDLRIFTPKCNQVQRVRDSSNQRTVGYVGTVDDRLDYNLLNRLAITNPQYDFHFIGRVITNKTGRLKSLSNVVFTGAVPPAELPSMMSRFDAGMIPFVKNEFTKNIYPMKVNEYLAMGIPVVSTSFAELSDLEGCIELADNDLMFSVKLNDVIRHNDQQKISLRKAKAFANSWQQKASEFQNILMKYA